MPVLADDDVVMHGDAKWRNDTTIALVIVISPARAFDFAQ
jgi:hypothetical protein